MPRASCRPAYRPRHRSRGSIFTVFGRGIGPAAPDKVSAFRNVSIEIIQGSTTVSAIPVFVSSGQLNAIMPSDAPLGRVSLRVTFNGEQSNPETVTVVENSVGIFTATGAGIGPGIVQNVISQTEQPINTTTRTAKPGQVVTMWATGLGPISAPDNSAPPPLREFTGCQEAGQVAFTADGERGLFSCKDTLWVYDILSDSVAQKITGFGAVGSLTVTLDGRRAYVAAIKDDKELVVIVSLETYDIVKTIELDAFPMEVFLGSDEQRVYVVGGRQLTIFDPEGNVESVVPTPGFAIGGLAVNVGSS